MNSFLTISTDTWQGVILGAILGSVVIPVVWCVIKKVQQWWRESRPAHKLLGGISDPAVLCRVFVRDFFIKPGTDLISVEPRLGVGVVPNVHELWPDVEGRAVAAIFSVLGQLKKTKNIEIVRMSQDVGEWDSHLFVLGAQANKSFDFYRVMKNVAYRMDNQEIYNNISGEIIPREAGFGYGLILKAENPFVLREKKKGIAFLIGGFGVLGTAAAAYYFRENYVQLGKDFDNHQFNNEVQHLRVF